MTSEYTSPRQQLRADFVAWRSERMRLATLEATDPVRPVEWEWSDDEAVALLHQFARLTFPDLDDGTEGDQP